MNSYFKEATALLERIRGMCTLLAFFLTMNQYDRHPEVHSSHQIADLGVCISFDATKVKASLQRVVQAEKAEHPEKAKLAEEFLDKLIELENNINRFNKGKK